MTDKLKPCPVCGRKPLIHDALDYVLIYCRCGWCSSRIQRTVKSVYERARKMLEEISFCELPVEPMITLATHDALLVALDAGEAAEKRAKAAERELREVMNAGESIARERDEGMARIAELECAYLIEKERRIAAEKLYMEMNH